MPNGSASRRTGYGMPAANLMPGDRAYRRPLRRSGRLLVLRMGNDAGAYGQGRHRNNNSTHALLLQASRHERGGAAFVPLPSIYHEIISVCGCGSHKAGHLMIRGDVAARPVPLNDANPPSGRPLCSAIDDPPDVVFGESDR